MNAEPKTVRRVALIPARGGSKRLPRKNILDFMGKPIIAWTIEAARQSGLFNSVVVSTEDPEIAAIAKQAGAHIHDRLPGLATDSARVVDVCLDFLSAQEQKGKAWDVLCCLYATAPLRTAGDIAVTVGLLQPGVCDFALAATSYDLPPHQALKIGNDGSAMPMWPDMISRRASEIGALAVDNGSTYAVNVAAFRQEKSFCGHGLKIHLMPRERSQDIDEAIDLELALFYAQRMKKPC